MHKINRNEIAPELIRAKQELTGKIQKALNEFSEQFEGIGVDVTIRSFKTEDGSCASFVTDVTLKI